MIRKFIQWWRKQWAYIPPRESDVVSVTIVRKNENGKLVEFSLDGDDANQWGWLLINQYGGYTSHPRSKKGFNTLNWKKKIL